MKPGAALMADGYEPYIGQLFAIESRCQNTTLTNRLIVRWRESRVSLAQIEEKVLRQLHAVLPRSAFGKALHHLQGQWPKLTLCVENICLVDIEQRLRKRD
uniref:IS66 family transposase n=1 Tax=Paraburkholderia sp. RL17-373-BIF-A TaxID=3031629 RepID=UPI0038B8D7B7